MHDYANAVLQGKAYRPDDVVEDEKGDKRPRGLGEDKGEGKGDMGAEVARLNFGIVRRLEVYSTLYVC